MNENVDLTKILENCPNNVKLYSAVHGSVYFRDIITSNPYPIRLETDLSEKVLFSKNGKIRINEGECVLFPSKDQRDWSKFTAPWFKREKFDPKTLKPFDKVLVTDVNLKLKWKVDFFSHETGATFYPYQCTGNMYGYCIPYNEETKHLVGTTKEPPVFYRYWDK